MTKNGFKTLVEEDFNGSINGALAELSYRGECPDKLHTAETLRLKVPNLLNVGEYELVSEIAIALMADTIYYRQDESHSDIIPVRTIDDVLDLFDDDVTENNEKELTLEDVKDWIATEGYSVDDVFNEDEIYDYVRGNCCVGDVFDEDDITDWVKENCYASELTRVEWE